MTPNLSASASVESPRLYDSFLFPTSKERILHPCFVLKYSISLSFLWFQKERPSHAREHFNPFPAKISAAVIAKSSDINLVSCPIMTEAFLYSIFKKIRNSLSNNSDIEVSKFFRNNPSPT